MKIYVTFGQQHRHTIPVPTTTLDENQDQLFKAVTVDKDCVAVIECNDHNEGRDKAFKLFGPKFCFTYTEERIDDKFMSYFPRGLLEV
jgi:hypothetical protein